MIDAAGGADAARTGAAANQETDRPSSGFKLFGADGFTFRDLLDIINPLQHIPVISTIYRSLTGDTIDPGARMAGATLFGGPIGAAFSVAEVVVEHNSGRDLGGHVVALLTGGQEDNAVALADSEAADPGRALPALETTRRAAAVLDLEALGAAEGGSKSWAPLALEPRRAVTGRQQVTAPPAPVQRHDTTASVGAIERAIAEDRNDWVVESMMRALDKYQAMHRLRSASAQASQSVVR